MELHERIAFVRKSAGLTQEQLGEKLGVTRQAVSKWESAQVTPDAATIARLCSELGVSADFVLLGKEPDGSAPTVPVTVCCPCCGKPAPQGTPACAGCGYDYYPDPADDDARYAIVLTGAGYGDTLHQQLMRFGGRTEEEARETLNRMQTFGEGHLDRVLLRRDLPRSAALWIAAAMRKDYGLCIVADDGFSDEHLLDAPEALALPEAHKPEESKSGIGFWGVVGAVVLGLLIASLL